MPARVLPQRGVEIPNRVRRSGNFEERSLREGRPHIRSAGIVVASERLEPRTGGIGSADSGLSAESRFPVSSACRPEPFRHMIRWHHSLISFHETMESRLSAQPTKMLIRSGGDNGGHREVGSRTRRRSPPTSALSDHGNLDRSATGHAGWTGRSSVLPQFRSVLRHRPLSDGVLLAPITASIIADLVSNGRSAWRLNPYARRDFGNSGTDDKSPKIQVKGP